MFTLGTLQTLKTLRTYLFRYAEEYPAINGGDEFGMNYIFTNRNKNSGLQAAVFYCYFPAGSAFRVWYDNVRVFFCR